MSNVRFVYVTTSKGRKATVAYQYNDSKQVIVLASAQCSASDRFEKRIGRNVAFNRLTATNDTREVSYTAIGGSKYGQVAEYVTRNIDSLLIQKAYRSRG